MRASKKAIVAMLATAALGGSATSGAVAFGHHHGSGHADRGGKALLKTSLAPSVPGDPALHGVAPGAAPWVLTRGEATLRRDGRFRARVRGLVIPSPPGDGTPGPVMTVSASLYCGNDTTDAGTTPSVPISRAGDARMEATLSLPAKCLAPVVLIHPNGSAALYITASGFGPR